MHNTGNNGGEPGNEDGQWSEKQISRSPGFAGKTFYEETSQLKEQRIGSYYLIEE